MTHSILTYENGPYTFQLLDQEKKVVFEFPFDYKFSFLTNDLTKTKISYYPILIFEFDNGFWTTKDLFLKHLELTEENKKKEKEEKEKLEKEEKEKLEKENSKDSKKDERLGPIPPMTKRTQTMANPRKANTKISYPDFSKSTPLIQFEVVPFYEFLQQCTQLNSQINQKNQEVKQDSNNNEEKVEETFQEEIKKIHVDNDYNEKEYKVKKMQERLKYLTIRNQIITELIDEINKLTNFKQQINLKVGLETLQLNKQNLVIKEKEHEKNASRINKYDILLNSLVNKKIAEVAYVFFNKGIDDLFSLTFSSKSSDLMDPQERYASYSTNARMFTRYMGNTAILFYYISKIFGIPLRYPIFINGSKSFCFVNKKEFISLFPDPKKDDRFQKFEVAMGFQMENLKEIMNYLFNYRNIISPETFDAINNKLEKKLFFSYFADFNSVIYDFIEKVERYNKTYYTGI